MTPSVGPDTWPAGEVQGPVEALSEAVRTATAAPDLQSALTAIARTLAAAVGAHTALIVATEDGRLDVEASAGELEPAAALQRAVSSNGDAPGDDVLIRYIGLSASFGFGAPSGAVLVVLPAAGIEDARASVALVQAFADLAELCVVQAQRLRNAERGWETDELTECLTRRTIERALSAEFERSRRSGQVFTIAFIDIDGFKRVNDAHGHLQGDAVLRRVGRALRDAARATDLVGRYGGDEFLLVMPGTDADNAAAACARLFAGAAAAVQADGLSLSFGTASWSGGRNASDLIEEADRAMFAAKRGRGGR